VTVAFWFITVLWQLFDPDNPFSPAGSHNQGIFMRTAGGSLMLGVILGSMLPLISSYFISKGRYWVAGFTVIVMGVFLYYTGTRSGWLSGAFSVAVILILLSIKIKWGVMKTLTSGIIILALGAIIFISVGQLVPGTATRVTKTLEFFKAPSFETFEAASSGRGLIWRDAIEMGRSNMLNGVGADAFRVAHPNYVHDGSEYWLYEWPQKDGSTLLIGASHPHQILLDSFASSGILGLLGLIGVYAIVFQKTVSLFRLGNWLGLGFALAFWSGFLPFNTHNNFYGGWMTAWLFFWIGFIFSFYNRKLTSKISPA